MAVPWLRLLDVFIGVTDLARSKRMASRGAPSDLETVAPGSRALGHIETRLAGVVVAALKEAFDRDTHRLELEREQLNAERERAERALKLEVARQTGERELGRLRLLAGVAVASWLGTLFFSAHLIGGDIAPRIVLGAGWLFMLGAIAASFVGQSRVAESLKRLVASSTLNEDIASGAAGSVAPWLIVVGLALVGLAALL
jgi:hypothetical protein